jgi:hypothetical protein
MTNKGFFIKQNIMRKRTEAIVTTNWEYKAEGGIIINLEEHEMFKGMFEQSIKEGSDGIYAWCFVTEDRLSYNPTEKLKRQIQGGEYDNFDELTEEEIDLQDEKMLTLSELFSQRKCIENGLPCIDGCNVVNSGVCKEYPHSNQ